MKWKYKEVNRMLKYGMGLMFMGCGTVLMLKSDLGVGISIRLGKTYIETVFLIIALGLKGPIGIGTIVVTFVSGALIQTFLYIIKERKEKRDGYVTRE